MTDSAVVQLAKFLGPAVVVLIVLVTAATLVVVASLVSKNGIAIGKFRAGFRRPKDSEPVAAMCAQHTAVLNEISAGLKEIKLHLEDQDQMLVGHGAVLGIVLDQFEGREINGQVEEARKIVDSNLAYHEALKRVLSKGAV